ncbi:MAG: metallophosphoesterase family protein [Silvibacterium sp.]
MKIAIIADIHANFAALRAFPEAFDELWVIGDLVNFGARPGEVIEWVRTHAHCVVRGNHDHAVGYDTDPRCIPAYRAMAAETGECCSSVLTEDQKQYLQLLPLTADRTLSGTRFYLCHATPSDPLFGYLEQESQIWESEVVSTRSDVTVVGHTHVPFLRTLGKLYLLNLGSLAGLKVTSPQASYATWEDGQFHLKRYSYPFDETVAAIKAMPISQAVREQLCELITTGDLMVGKD